VRKWTRASVACVRSRRTRRLEIPYEEWEVLFRGILLVERTAAKAGMAPSTYGLLQRLAARSASWSSSRPRRPDRAARLGTW
jgi:hypothetical protein